MTASRSETIWLGEVGADDSPDYEILVHNSMISISCTQADGSVLEVLIRPNLFGSIRRRLDEFENLGQAEPDMRPLVETWQED